MPRVLLTALVSALLCACASGSSSAPAERGYLHVLVRGLPQCAYGIGYERPLRIELSDRDRALATAYTSGIYVGDESLQVSLYVEDAEAARYRIRVGACPSLLDEPQASVQCDDVDWRRSVVLPLVPRGIDTPEVVDVQGLRARCLDPS